MYIIHKIRNTDWQWNFTGRYSIIHLLHLILTARQTVSLVVTKSSPLRVIYIPTSSSLFCLYAAKVSLQGNSATLRFA